MLYLRGAIKKYIMTTVNIDYIKQSYPDEWILLGNPEIDEQNQTILSGVVLYHSPDKREVVYLGKPLTAEYEKIAMFFNRVTPRHKKRSVISSLYYPVENH
jgi:hypothetical protein